MAMLQLGKLKFRYKDGGLDFRWGDGEVKRLGKKNSGEIVEDYADSYSEYDDDAAMGYDGRFADDSEYAEDDYADDVSYDADEGYDDYADEGYGDYDDGYAEEDYSEEDDYGYSDEEEDQYGGYADEDDSYQDYGDDYPEEDYDDGYDDGYGYDDQYDHYDEEYDDRYSDEDADDASYIGGDYEGYSDGYDYDDYPEGGLSGLLQYVDENDWVSYLLLVLLPPLGIYLLWRRQRFEPMVRYAISAASAVWFVVMIVLLITLVFSGQNDATNAPQVPTLAPTVEATMTPAPSASPTVAPNTTANLTQGLSPAATPIGGAPTISILQGNVVWTSASGNYYHNSNECEKAVGETLSQTTLDNAKNRGKYECPVCYGGQIFYARPDGDYYHLVKDCSGMKNAIEYTQDRIDREKKAACPVCVTKTQNTLDETPANAKLTFVTSSTKDKSGIKVWCTSGGSNYHMTKNCRGMSGAKQVGLSEALLMGKTACKTCCAVSGEMVYCTKGGTYYHRNKTCSGMTHASSVTIAEALVLGKKECPTCRPVANNSAADTSTNANGTTAGESGNTPDEYYVYATAGGDFYHVKKNCSGMSGAKRVTLTSMIKEGRPACPECCSGAAMSVYASKGGTYYHSYATCTGMTNAKQGTLADALANGYKRCPRCWGDNEGTTAQGNANNSVSSENATADTVMVYATKNGKWYHTKSNCTGMRGARHITLSEAMEEGKTACATCATTANKIVYSTNSGKYYHAGKTCDNMKGASQRTLAEALKKGQTACPICMTEKSDNEVEKEPVNTPDKVADFTVGKSGIKVYASPSEKYYHAKSTCSNANEMEHVALETALNYGRKPCSKCLSTADDKVYATKNGKYYHVSKSCAGSGASSGVLANALAYGFAPCPYCVTGEKTESPAEPDTKYESGRSGIQVYAKADGKYYHANKSCAGSGAVKVTLETALNYGKKACQECLAVADRTVYAVRGTLYYHASKDCAGNGAVKGNYAQALAYGLTACPNCIGGGAAGTPSSPAPSEAPEYTAPADSSVYIDLYADHFYYHKSSKCSGSGMSGGTEVTLEYAKDFGYERCPYCNPASNVG